MIKIMCLIPCLMLPNNRDVNKKAMDSNYTHLKLDKYVVYDQCFEDADFDPRFEYIGHANCRMGWVTPRNELLRYFYESDYDYAFWIDANSSVSQSTLNDLTTIIDNLHNHKLDECDAIFATLGMWISQERMMCKAAEDYFDVVHLIPTKNNKSYNWMHGLFHKNFKKYYNQEYYIDERCDTKQGTADDVYFSRLLQRFTNCYVAPTVIINKPSSKASCTWANDKGTYEYPPTLYDKIDEYILESADKNGFHHVSPLVVRKEILLDRNDYLRESLKPYVPRSKKKSALEVNGEKIKLF